jgi:uncharacterized protein YndB with AHSA1/START domain
VSTASPAPSPASSRGKARSVAPIRASVEVAVAPAKAFAIFTERLSEWWPLDYALVPKPRQVIVEPKKGGRWYEKGADGSERLVATVTAWDPSSRFAIDWHIDAQWQSDPKLATAVEVRFTPTAKGTRVELEHRDLEKFGEQAEATRKGLSEQGGWGDLLQGFARLANAKV